MPRCFVISPIGADDSAVREHADLVFHFIIVPALEPFKLDAVRADQLKEPGKITDQMFREIVASDVCIAVLTGANPNVLYELAVAHTSERPVILLARRGEALPFDVQDWRCVRYDLDAQKLSKGVYADEVAQHLRALERAAWKGSSLATGLGRARMARYTLSITSPSDMPELDITNIEWDSERCFLKLGVDLRERVTLVPSMVGPAFDIEIAADALDRIQDRPIELDLTDRKGLRWRVKPFYLFKSVQTLTLSEPRDAIIRAYQDDDR